MITNMLYSVLRTRLGLAMTVLVCVSLSEQAAFAQKAVFQRVKPHVNVGTIDRLEPIPDQFLTSDDAMQPESPCPCRNGDGDLKADVGAPVELLVLLTPRLDPESLRDGEDVAFVYADVPGLDPDAYLLRLYEFEEGFLTTFVNRSGDEVAFESQVRVTEGDGAEAPWGGFGCSKSGGYCCLTVCNASGCAWICISKDLTIYAGWDSSD